MAEYSKNEEAEKIAGDIIPEDHPEIVQAKIEYLFTDKTAKKRGKVVLAKTVKASDLQDYLSNGADFLIIFGQEEWDQLTDEQRKALVDQMLCYCDVKTDKDGNDGFVLRGPDVEGFSANIERYGLWKEDLVEFVKIGGKQLTLPMEPGKTKRRRANGHDRHSDA